MSHLHYSTSWRFWHHLQSHISCSKQVLTGSQEEIAYSSIASPTRMPSKARYHHFKVGNHGNKTIVTPTSDKRKENNGARNLWIHWGNIHYLQVPLNMIFQWKQFPSGIQRFTYQWKITNYHQWINQLHIAIFNSKLCGLHHRTAGTWHDGLFGAKNALLCCGFPHESQKRRI